MTFDLIDHYLVILMEYSDNGRLICRRKTRLKLLLILMSHNTVKTDPDIRVCSLLTSFLVPSLWTMMNSTDKLRLRH